MEGVEVMGESDEGEDDSADEQVCVNLKKEEETLFLNGSNCVNHPYSDLVRGAEDIFVKEGDKIDFADVDHNRWKCEFEIKI
jgi:hypothetical protein